MRYYQCTSPECEFTTMREDRDTCPWCGNETFAEVEESEITPGGGCTFVMRRTGKADGSWGMISAAAVRSRATLPVCVKRAAGL